MLCTEGLNALIKVDYEKLAISFSKNARDDIKQEDSNTLGISVVACPARYLGLPTQIGKKTRGWLLTRLGKGLLKRFRGGTIFFFQREVRRFY